MGIGLQPVPLDGGVNSQLVPTAIEDNQLQAADNFSGRQGQDPGVRPAMAFSREVVPDYREWNSARYDAGASNEEYHRWAQFWRPMKFIFPPFGGDVAGVFQVAGNTDPGLWGGGRQIIDTTKDTNTPRNVLEQEAVLWMLPSLYAGGDVNGGPYCLHLGVMTRAPSMFVFDGKIYAFGGSNAGGHIERDSGGVNTGPALGWVYQPNVWETPQAAPFIPDGACVVRDRVLYYKDQKVYWSDRGAPLRIGANALQDWWLNITGEEQEFITAAAELSTSADGSPVQSVAAVWTKSRCYMLLGEPLETIDPAIVDADANILGSLQINRLNIECGCISQSTVTRTPYGTFWVGMDDVWFMPYGSLPIRVGTNIRPAIKAVPPALGYRICAEYSNGFYKIALPGPECDGASPLSEIWSLDLNEGVPQTAEQAAWWGPHTLCNSDSPDVTGGGGTEGDGGGASGMWAWARDTRATGDGKLYSLQSYLINRTSDLWPTYGMSLCGWDQFGMRDIGAPSYAPRPWQKGTAYFEGDVVVPPPFASDGVSPLTRDMTAAHFVCVTAGVSDSAEPDWYASGVPLITDNTAQWRPIYYNGGYALPSYRSLAHQQSNNVLWRIVSKEYTLGDPISEKLLDGAEIAFNSQLPQQLTYKTHPDQQSRSRVIGVAPTNLDVSTGPYAQVGYFLGMQAKQRKLMTADPTKRFNSQTAVMILQSDPGYVIVEGFNDTIGFRLDGALYAITIPPGYYKSLTTVLEALEAEVKARSGMTLLSTVASDGGYYRARLGVKDYDGLVVVTLAAYGALAGMLGFTQRQVSTDNAANPALYLMAENSYEVKQASDMQLNALNIRFGVFGRRPT